MTATTERPAAPAPDVDRTPLLQRPLASWSLLLTSTLLLLVLGLVMVFSASSVAAYRSLGSSYAIVAKQARNEARTWPDWRTAPLDRAIEHDRSVQSSTGAPR